MRSLLAGTKPERKRFLAVGAVEAHTCLGVLHLHLLKEVLSTLGCLKRSLLATQQGQAFSGP